MDGELNEEELGQVGGGTLPYEEGLKAELERLNNEMKKPGLSESEREDIRRNLESLKEELNNFMTMKNGGRQMQ